MRFIEPLLLQDSLLESLEPHESRTPKGPTGPLDVALSK